MQNYFDNLVSSRTNRPAAGVTVHVTRDDGGAFTLYSDNGVTEKANPFTTNANGFFEFYARDGWYTVIFSVAGVELERRKKLLEDPADSPSPTLAALAAPTGAGLMGTIQSGTGAVARTVQDKLRDVVNIADFGGVEGQYIDDVLDVALLALNENGTLEFTNKKLPYKIGRPHVIKKNVTLKGYGFSAQDLKSGGTTDYSKTCNIITDDGIVAFVLGIARGISATTYTYDTGRLVLSGLSARPVTANSAGSVFLQYNQDHNLEVTNNVFRYFDAALDLCGCWGAEVHDNIFASNNYSIVADPDFNYRDGNADGTMGGFEVNDLHIYGNTFGGAVVGHIKVNCYGHMVRVHGNSIEAAPFGVSLSGYGGAKTGFAATTLFGGVEYDNYYEKIGVCVIIGAPTGRVEHASVGGSYVNAAAQVNGYGLKAPYCKVVRATHLDYKSGSIFVASADSATYAELIFDTAYNKPVEYSCDIKLRYKYSGALFLADSNARELQKIEYLAATYNPAVVYVNGADVNAVGSANTASGANVLTEFDVGSVARPLRNFTELRTWLTRTPLGMAVMRYAPKLQVNIAGNVALSTLDCEGLRVVEILTSAEFSKNFVVINGQEVRVKNALLRNTGDVFFGQFAFINSDVVIDTCTFTADVVTGGATAWLKVEESRLRFKNPTFNGVGKIDRVARIYNGSTVYGHPSITAAVSTSAPLVVDTGNAANIVAVV